MKSWVAWVAVSAAAWAFAAGAFALLITLMLQSIMLSDTWIIVSATAGFAYAFTRLLRKGLGAPRGIWAGVAVIQAVSPLVMLAGIIALMAGGRSQALEYMLVTGVGGAILPLADQLGFLVVSEIVPALLVTFGAWLGSRAPSATGAETACLTSASS